MATEVRIATQAEKDIKRLRKKYRAVTSEVRKLVVELESD